MPIELYGHPFSSYTWKAEIALRVAGLDYDFMTVGPGEDANNAFLAAHAGPQGKFPLLKDGETVVFEATSIIEHLAANHPSAAGLIPPDRAAQVRVMDRVFDNYVMNVMQVVVDEHIRSPDAPDATRCEEARARLRRSYDWLEAHAEMLPADSLDMAGCAAAPSLFYADWIEPIGADRPALAACRAWLLARPEVVHCVEAARPYRGWFPPGAPDRD